MRHRPPVGVPASSWYFITICAVQRGIPLLTRDDISPQLLQAARYLHDQGKWRIYLALLMPDHFHVISHFPDAAKMGEIIGGWKRYTNKLTGVVWQKDFFDHRLRGDESAESKRIYVLNNPVRAGLVARPTEWPHQWSPPEIFR